MGIYRGETPCLKTGGFSHPDYNPRRDITVFVKTVMSEKKSPGLSNYLGSTTGLKSISLASSLPQKKKRK